MPRAKTRPCIAITAVLALALVVAVTGVADTAPEKSTSYRHSLRIAYWVGHHPGWGETLKVITDAFCRQWNAEHPDDTAQFKHQYQPHQGYDMWSRTQYLGEMAPDLVQQFTGKAWEYGGRNGFLVPLKRYLYKENPYNPGTKWINTFYPHIVLANRDPAYFEYWTVAYGTVTLRYYYNKDIFNDVGVEPPSTWRELMEICSRIKDAGIIPVAVGESDQRTTSIWTFWNLMPQLLAYRTPLMDVLEKNDNQDGMEEVYYGIKNKHFSLMDPQQIEIYRLVKEYSQYWNEGFNGIPWDGSKDLFYQGKAAMMMNGSWEATGVDENTQGRFEWGIFRVPVLTKESSPYALGPAIENIASSGVEFAVSKDCQRRGNLEVAIAFLQYLTAPSQLKLMAEGAVSIPIVHDVDLSEAPMVREFMPRLRGNSANDGIMGFAQMGDEFKQEWQLFMGGDTELDAFARKVDALYHKNIKKYLKLQVRDYSRSMGEIVAGISRAQYRLQQARKDGDQEAVEEYAFRLQGFQDALEDKKDRLNFILREL